MKACGTLSGDLKCNRTSNTGLRARRPRRRRRLIGEDRDMAGAGRHLAQADTAHAVIAHGAGRTQPRGGNVAARNRNFESGSGRACRWQSGLQFRPVHSEHVHQYGNCGEFDRARSWRYRFRDCVGLSAPMNR